VTANATRAATSPHTKTPTQPVSSSQSDSSSRAASAFGRLPLRFEANQGQTDARVKFLARGDGYNHFLTPGEAVLSLDAEARDAKGARAAEGRASAAEVKAKKTPGVLRMKFVGAEVKAGVAGVEELPGRSNYFRGADPSKWQTDVRAYARVRYAGIYPGVDLEYYGDRSRLEYGTIPVKLTVCGPNGNNLSSPTITVRAVGVGLVTTTVYGDVQDSGNANPDGNFRLVGGFYVFNMSTKGLTTGGYYLYFTVGSDPTLHTAPFNLK
jgi:hypothetical protein